METWFFSHLRPALPPSPQTPAAFVMIASLSKLPSVLFTYSIYDNCVLLHFLSALDAIGHLLKLPRSFPWLSLYVLSQRSSYSRLSSHLRVFMDCSWDSIRNPLPSSVIVSVLSGVLLSSYLQSSWGGLHRALGKQSVRYSCIPPTRLLVIFAITVIKAPYKAS